MSDEEKQKEENNGGSSDDQKDDGQSSGQQDGGGNQGNGDQQGEQSQDGDKQLSKAEASLTEQDPPPTILEWAVRIASLLVILGLASYLVWTGLQPTKQPEFDFQVRLGDVAERQDRFIVPVDVTNVGSFAVSDLTIELTLTAADGSKVEEVSTTIALIGQNELHNIEFWLNNDPSEFQTEGTVTGYQVP